jgi:hypothetical protein
MDLRPDLTPPALDEDLVQRLAALADRLDGAYPGQYDEDLAEFNRLAGTMLLLHEFQGIYGGDTHEAWVRRTLYSHLIKPAVKVTPDELVEVARRAIPMGESPDQSQAYMAIFDANVPLAGASNLIFFPRDYDAVTNTWGGGRPLGEYRPTPEQLVAWALESPTGS